MSVVVGLFSNYAYDIKYMDTADPDYAENKKYKLNRFNWMILVLTIGISVVFYYFTNTTLARPKVEQKVEPSDNKSEASSKL